MSAVDFAVDFVPEVAETAFRIQGTSDTGFRGLRVAVGVKLGPVPQQLDELADVAEGVCYSVGTEHWPEDSSSSVGYNSASASASPVVPAGLEDLSSHWWKLKWDRSRDHRLRSQFQWLVARAADGVVAAACALAFVVVVAELTGAIVVVAAAAAAGDASVVETVVVAGLVAVIDDEAVVAIVVTALAAVLATVMVVVVVGGGGDGGACESVGLQLVSLLVLLWMLWLKMS